MDIKIESLVPIERLQKDVDSVFRLVDKNNTVVVLKDNQPAYLIVKHTTDAEHLEQTLDSSYESGPDKAKKSGPKARKAGSRKTRQVTNAADSEGDSEASSTVSSESPRYKLQEAMKIVLAETESKHMHVAEVAEEIFQRGLYRKRDGTKAQPNQLRASCTQHADLFEVLPGNIIKLKEGIE